MSEELLAAIEGTIKAPRHPNLLAIADVLRDIGRRVEGSPAEYLVPGQGLGDYLAKLAYDEQPSGWDRLGAVGDLADVIPGGGALLGAAAAIPAKAGRKAANAALDMSKAARMQRAAEQGFDTGNRLFHGTAGDFNSFGKGGSVTKARSAKEATWLTDDPEVAGGYARMAAEDAPVQRLLDESRAAELDGNYEKADELMRQAEELDLSGRLVGGGGQNIIPLHTKTNNLLEFDADGATMSDLDDSQLYMWTQEAKAGGYDGLKIDNFSDNADYGIYNPATHYAIFDPASIRSENARFDPQNIGKNDMSGFASPEMMRLLAVLAGAGYAGSKFLGDDVKESEAAQAFRPRKID